MPSPDERAMEQTATADITRGVRVTMSDIRITVNFSAYVSMLRYGRESGTVIYIPAVSLTEVCRTPEVMRYMRRWQAGGDIVERA